MSEVETSIDIDAPPEAVWALAMDPARLADWVTIHRGAEWLDGVTEAKVGAWFAGHNQHPAIGEWTATSEIVECEPCRAFAWSVGGAAEAAATWRFELTPDGDGTRLKQWMRMGPARSGLTPAIQARPDKEERIVARRQAEHAANMQATVDGIKALAEAAPTD